MRNTTNSTSPGRAVHEATARLREEAEKRGLWSGAVLLVRTTIRAARHGRTGTVVTRA